MSAFSYDFCCLFINTFIFFFLKTSPLSVPLMIHKTFSCNLYLYTSCLFSMLLNDDILNIENRICSPNFVADEFSRLFFTSINLFY